MKLIIDDRIINRSIDFFSDVKINLHLNSVASTFQLVYFFDPNNPDHKDFSVPGHYHICKLEHEGTLLLTGYILSHKFKSVKNKQLVAIAGSSLPGVLEHCEISPLDYPLQSDGLSIREIAQKYIKRFNLGMVVTGNAASDMDAKYDQTDAKDSQNIKSYLTELTQQKNIILTHNPQGQLVFTKVNANQKPILEINPQTTGLLSMEFDFDGSQMHSDISVFSQPEIDDDSQFGDTPAIKNPYVFTVYRPKVARLSSGKGDDLGQAQRNLLSAELRGMQWVFEFDQLILNGAIPMAGQIVTAINPEVYLYDKTKLMIESVEISDNAEEENLKLHCVIPEVYTGGTPKYIFQGINLR